MNNLLRFRTLLRVQNAALSSRGAEIQSSIDTYLKKVMHKEELMGNERASYERGRRFLASMMGADPANFDQDAVDAAIRYLFPSMLYHKGARPMLKPPEYTFPKTKLLMVNSDGRPKSHLFFTGKPNFYEICHEATMHLEEINTKVDNALMHRDWAMWKERRPLELLNSDWWSHQELEKKTGEKIKPHQFENWKVLMTRLASHDLAYLAESFIMRYRRFLQKNEDNSVAVVPEVDPENANRKLVSSFGQKKNALASIRLFYPGQGEISVNDRSLLEIFPLLGDREQIMFPLAYTSLLGKVDIVAQVTGPEPAHASKSNALRLAISRALACFDEELPERDLKNRLQVAGLLTQDDRFKERKKPGQPKARAKWIWKAR